MKYFIIIFCFSLLPVHAQLVNNNERAHQIADSLVVKGMGEIFFKKNLVFDRIFTYESVGSSWVDTLGVTRKEIITQVWYKINIYNKVDSIDIWLYNRFVYKPCYNGSDPRLAIDLQDPSKYPLMNNKEFKKVLRKKKGIWKTLSFEFIEDGVIAFFTARRKDPKRPNCIYSDAINLQLPEIYSGYWWCEQ
jgi:hypothetical protein